MLEQNVRFDRARRISSWRKVAIGTWGNPGDPSIYAKMNVDATEMLERIERLSQDGEPLTPLILVIHAVGHAIEQNPSLNSVLRWGRLHRRRGVNIAVPVLPDSSGEDRTAVLIRDCDLKSEVELADELRARSSEIRRGEDRDFEATKETLSRVPGLLIRPVIRFLGFLLYTLNFWHERIGVPKDAFGSAQVTSVGAFGIEEGYGPLDPYSRCPMMVVVGRLEQVARVIDGQLAIRPMLSICFTFDHRIIDGMGCARVMNSIRSRLETPAKPCSSESV